jgi:hypothetical protein
VNWEGEGKRFPSNVFLPEEGCVATAPVFAWGKRLRKLKDKVYFGQFPFASRRFRFTFGKQREAKYTLNGKRWKNTVIIFL